MSGNSFFARQAQSIEFADEYKSMAYVFSCRTDCAKLDMDIEWNQAIETLEEAEICMEELIPKMVAIASVKETPIIKTEEKTPETRMQEIEAHLLEKADFRNIDGKLCIWNGRYYKQLDLESFTQEARRLLSTESQKRISHFSRFREAYGYMLANDSLREKFSEEAVKATKHMIVFRNGIYDAEKGKLIPHTPQYPVLFQIEADYLGDGEVKTPYMDSIINHATGCDEDVLILHYESIGYIYSQGNQAKKCFVLGYSPDSGKSIIGEFIGKTVGESNVSTISLNDFGKKFALGTINQVALNYNMDLPAAELDKIAVQKIKQLTGDARIECEEKFMQSRTVKHHCKFLFATNHPIQLKHEDEAFFNRLILIPFIYSVCDVDRDYDLPEKLWQERNAIATKAAHAYRKLYMNNFVFQKSRLADEILKEWRADSTEHLMKDFFCQCCERVGADMFIPTDVLFKAYQEFCKKNDKWISDDNKAQFSKQFRTLFKLQCSKRRVEGYNSPVNGYIGIDLHNVRLDSY